MTDKQPEAMELVRELRFIANNEAEVAANSSLVETLTDAADMIEALSSRQADTEKKHTDRSIPCPTCGFRIVKTKRPDVVFQSDEDIAIGDQALRTSSEYLYDIPAPSPATVEITEEMVETVARAIHENAFKYSHPRLGIRVATFEEVWIGAEIRKTLEAQARATLTAALSTQKKDSK